MHLALTFTADYLLQLGGLAMLQAYEEVLTQVAEIGGPFAAIKVSKMTRNKKSGPDNFRLHLGLAGSFTDLSFVIKSKNAYTVAQIYKQIAATVDQLASNQVFVVEGADPANWTMDDRTRKVSSRCGMPFKIR